MVSRERGGGLGHAHSAAKKSVEIFDPKDLTCEDCAEVTCDGFGDGFQSKRFAELLLH